MCSDSPDMSGVNAAAQQNAEIGREQLGLAREQYADAKSRAAEYDPLFKQLIQSSLDQQTTAAAQSADQWKTYQDLFKPAEEKLATTAMNYDTPERRAQEAQAAGAGMAQQFDLKRQALDRDLGRANVTVGSGKGLALLAGNRMDEAKATASAENNARKQVEQTGISLVDNAARFGRNMPSTGIQTAQLAMQAGNQAGNTVGQQQSAISSSLAPSQGFYSGATGATSSAGNLALGAANTQLAANAQSNAGWSSLASLGGTLLGSSSNSILGSMMASGGLLSSQDFKEVGGDVDPDAALDAVVRTPVKAWRYLGDDQVRLGPMAEAVAEANGLGNGKTLDVATELGTLRAAVQGVVRKLDAIGGGSGAPRRRLLAEAT
ncbi:MAG: hypothetical protein WAQ08_16165 [Aquabacterium sp.]|uniref:hypothetical protein n=1 Tax=Aquabacterium sp. TaxID=1872578 RepID=UPI003BAF0E2E